MSAAIVIILAVAALALAGVVLAGPRTTGPQHVTFYLRHAPDATRQQRVAAKLVDQRGRIFTLAQLRGQPVVVAFVAAHCSDACPLINAHFSKAVRAFKQTRTPVKLLTITLDPEHDPPAVMRELAQRFQADPRIWLVAGGSIPSVHAIMRSFGVVAQKGRKGYADVHTTFIYFLNSRGALQKVELASTNLSRQIVDDVKNNWRALAV